MYNNVYNSKTYHFQQKSLKNTQYLGLGGHFYDLGKTGLKTHKLSFCQFNFGQMKHNFKKLKEAFADLVKTSLQRRFCCGSCEVHSVEIVADSVSTLLWT